MGLVSELERLQQLHESGAISEEEFRRAKEALLPKQLAPNGEASEPDVQPARSPLPPPPPPTQAAANAGDDGAPSQAKRIVGGVLAAASLILLFVLIAGGDALDRISLPPIGSGPDTIDMERVEREISRQLSNPLGDIEVECPSSVEVTPGRDFRCTMSWAGIDDWPFPGRIEASVQNSAGDVYWEAVATQASTNERGHFFESQQGHVLRAIAD